MSDTRKSNRSRKVVNYSKFGGDGLDDDFHDATPPPRKTTNMTNERQTKRKKPKNEDDNNSDEEWSFERSPVVEKKKRLSAEEKRFERDLNAALTASQSNPVDPVNPVKENVKILVRNHVMIDDDDDIEVIGTVDDHDDGHPMTLETAIRSSRRGGNTSTGTRETLRDNTSPIASSPEISHSDYGEGEETDEDFNPSDSDSDSKSKQLHTKQPAKEPAACGKKSAKKRTIDKVVTKPDPKCSELPSGRISNVQQKLTVQKTFETGASNVTIGTASDSVTAAVNLERISASSPTKPTPVHPPPITSTANTTPISPLTSISPSTPSSRTARPPLTPKLTSASTQKSNTTPKSNSSCTINSELNSSVTSPGLRLGLSRKQRVKSLHPSATQIKT